MLAPELGSFDHVVAMDSLIHYEAPDIVAALARIAPRVRRSILFTVAPRTHLLAAMHAIAPGAPSRHESLSGACWTAIAGDLSADGTVPVAITGEVYPTGAAQWADAASDPLSRGVPWT